MISISDMEINLACKTQNNFAEDFSLIRIREIVDHTGKEIVAFKKKKGIRNFLVVVNERGEKFTAEDISNFIKNRCEGKFPRLEVRIRQGYLNITCSMYSDLVYKSIPELKELLG